MRCIYCGNELGSEGFHQPWPWIWRCSGCDFLCEDENSSFGRGKTRRYWFKDYPKLILVPEGCLLVMGEV